MAGVVEAILFTGVPFCGVDIPVGRVEGVLGRGDLSLSIPNETVPVWDSFVLGFEKNIIYPFFLYGHYAVFLFVLQVFNVKNADYLCCEKRV